MICTFFGHRNTPPEVRPLLRAVLLDMIENQNVKRFFVGHQGSFDAMVRDLLDEFVHTHLIEYDVVLAYLPKKTDPFFETYYTVFPEGIENVPPKFAIDYRNRWMVEKSDIVVTYVCLNFGGAAKFKNLAAKKGKVIIELSEEYGMK